MNAEGDCWWNLQSLWIRYVWFDRLDALQIRKTNLIARNATHQGVGFYSIFFPFRERQKKVTPLCSTSKHLYRKWVSIEICVSPAGWSCVWWATKKKAPILFFPMYLVCLCVCTHMHKCECVRVSASESQRLEMEALFRTWKFEDDLIGQDSDPFLTFALQTLQETLFVYLCSLSNSVYVPASKAFRFLQVHFLIISRPVFPYQRICPQHVLC